mmetsp:Transcript_11187/g.14562  ORF Transcript_11187/g.14562 Transcript_11187/m.14562 type:complete len:202 (-) Transcript_11187:950-1555(-)
MTHIRKRNKCLHFPINQNKSKWGCHQIDNHLLNQQVEGVPGMIQICQWLLIYLEDQVVVVVTPVLTVVEAKLNERKNYPLNRIIRRLDLTQLVQVELIQVQMTGRTWRICSEDQVVAAMAVVVVATPLLYVQHLKVKVLRDRLRRIQVKVDRIQPVFLARKGRMVAAIESLVLFVTMLIEKYSFFLVPIFAHVVTVETTII